MSAHEGRRTQGPVTLVAVGTALVLTSYVIPFPALVDTAADLRPDAVERSWILSSTSLGLAVALLPTGAWGDARGRRRGYLLGLALLGASALAAAVAPTPWLLVATRAVAGVGGAAVLSCGLGLLAAYAPDPVARGRATAVWGASVGLGISAGAILGVVLVETLGWRGCWAVVGAVTLAALLPSARGLEESRAEDRTPLDVRGTGAIAVALTLVVVAVTQARGGLGAPVLVTGALALLAVGALVVVELRAAHPVLDPRLLASPGFLATTVAAACVGLGIIATTSSLPLVVERGLGSTLLAATGLILVWSVLSTATSLVVRRYPVRGDVGLALGLATLGVGVLLEWGVTAGDSPWRLVPGLVVAGAATGVLNALMGREAVANVPPARAAMGSGANNAARYLGAACGITVFALLLARGGSGAESTASGWNDAVLVAAALTFGGAAVVGLLGRIGRRARA